MGGVKSPRTCLVIASSIKWNRRRVLGFADGSMWAIARRELPDVSLPDELYER